jgi:hypothetical protein
VWCLAVLERGPEGAQEMGLVDEFYESVPVRLKVCVVSFCRLKQAVTESLHMHSPRLTFIAHATSEIDNIFL